jgi:hypothetical protein
MSRWLVNAEATCKVGEDSFIGVACTLSEDGLFIETAWLPREGSKVEVELSFRGYPMVLRLAGEVARLGRDGARGSASISSNSMRRHAQSCATGFLPSPERGRVGYL